MTTKNVWIIGASTGIGASLATLMQKNGWEVTISARNAEALKQVANKSMKVEAFDIADASAAKRIAKRLHKQGKLDLIIISAGYWKQDEPLEFNADEFKKHVDINLIGLSNVIDATLPLLKQQDRGHLAVISSVAGYRGMPGALGYGATKAAQINLFEAFRATFRGTNIKFQTISPGFVETPMTATNTFPMPFIINADKAAQHILAGLNSTKPEIVFPFAMALTMKIAKLVPQRLWIKLVGTKTDKK